MQNNESKCALVANEYRSSPEDVILHAKGVSPYTRYSFTL